MAGFEVTLYGRFWVTPEAYGPGISLAGATAVVLTASGFCAAIPTRQLLKLQKQRLQKSLERGLAAGKSLKEVMQELDRG